MADVNLQIIVGRLTKDPVTRETQAGNPVCSFSVAVNTKEGQGQEHTEFFSIVTFGQTAFACGNHLKKGSQVYVEGRTKTRKWTDAEGAVRYRTEIISSSVQFLSERRPSQEGAA